LNFKANISIDIFHWSFKVDKRYVKYKTSILKCIID